MHPYTAVIAQRQLEELRAIAAEQRLARIAASADRRPGRLARSLAAVKAAVTTPASQSTMDFIPKLTDYPSRG
jgi:hypothetical protein